MVSGEGGVVFSTRSTPYIWNLTPTANSPNSSSWLMHASKREGREEANSHLVQFNNKYKLTERLMIHGGFLVVPV